LSDKKLVVYGDSFAAPLLNNNNYISWVDILSNKLLLPTYNKAIAGSSIEYSIGLFSEDVKSNYLKSNDIIIFIITSPGRLHLNYQLTKPHTASNFIRNIKLKDTWYNSNVNYINWYLTNRDENIININTVAYLHMLSAYARNNPNSTVLVLSMNRINNFIGLNIDNFLVPDITLWDISENEFGKGITFRNLTPASYGRDPRYNHLSIPNLEILADLLYESLTIKTINNFSYKKFKSNILTRKIRSLEDINYYVDNKILYGIDYFRRVFAQNTL
jgi:hypothetical protein